MNIFLLVLGIIMLTIVPVHIYSKNYGYAALTLAIAIVDIVKSIENLV